MIVNADWKPMTPTQEARRLKWLHEQERRGVTSFTLEDIGLLLCDAISRFTPDEKAHLRAKLYRRHGLDSGGKPS